MYNVNLCQDGYLQTAGSSQHLLYWQEYGTPQGEPVMILHGGPGSGAMVDQARFYDPDAYRIILFDQRGAGKSTPHASTSGNTMQHLIEDINHLRRELKIDDKMHLFGGSWGSTLALVYAIQYPENVASITLYGVFLGRESDIESFYQSNAADMSKAAGAAQKELHTEWERYVTFIPQGERGDMIDAYHKRLTSNDKALKLEASGYWNRWERAASKRLYDADTVAIEPKDAYSLAHACIENHYFKHGLFLGEAGARQQNYILDNADKLKNIKLAIVQGEHDKVCPKEQALALYERLKGISDQQPPRLAQIETAGHTMRDEGMEEALFEAVERLKADA